MNSNQIVALVLTCVIVFIVCFTLPLGLVGSAIFGSGVGLLEGFFIFPLLDDDPKREN